MPGKAEAGQIGYKVVMDNPMTVRLAAATQAVEDVVDQVLEFEAVNAQNDMRDNAPWNDVTGNARQGLFAQQYAFGGEHGMILYHTVPYGIFLETRWSGRYRIIVPVMQRTGKEVMRTLRSVMRTL